MLCFTEHFLRPEEEPALSIPGFTISSCYSRTKHRCGGAMILTRADLDCTERIDLVEKTIEMDCEIAAVEIKKLNMVIVTVYRPPNGNYCTFLDQITQILEILMYHSRLVIITGDFNIVFNINDNRKKSFIDLFSSYNFTQQIHANTRRDACLDNIFVNFENDLEFNCNVLKGIASDHSAVQIGVNIVQGPKNKTIMTNSYRPITAIGTNKLYNILAEVDWSFIKSSITISEKCNKFMQIILDNYCECFPVKRVRTHNNGIVRWYSEELGRMREHLSLLNDLYQSHKTDDLRQQRDQYRRHYRNTIKRAKKKANSNYVEKSTNKIKAAWNIINQNRGSNQNKNFSPAFNSDEFNKHFSTIAEKILNDMPKVNIDPKRYFSPQSQNLSLRDFSFAEVTYINVRDAIDSLKPKSCKDIYGLNTILLKKLKDIILIPITNLINCCIRENYYPDIFKKSKIVPVLKKGDPKNLNNYRPITIIPALSKIFEYLLKEQLYAHMENKNLFTDSQFGFRKSKSTTDAITSLLEFIIEGFERSEHVGMVLCDLTKAFDCISHHILLEKLKIYGFSQGSLQLMHSYLNDRTQQTCCEGKLSPTTTVKHGVPQGSILGPLLFLIYINDINAATGTPLIIFADDTTAILRHKNIVTLTEQMNLSLKELETWFSANGLSLNIAKTEQIILSLRHSTMNDTWVNCVKLLGIYLDKTLNFECHVDMITKKLSTTLFLLNSLKNKVNQNILKTAYHSFFHSHCTYGILAWGHSAQAVRIFKMQRRAVRVIMGLHYRADVRSAFVELNILTLPCIFILASLNYVKKSISNYQFCCEQHSHDTRKKTDIRIPHARLHKSCISTTNLGPKFYNKLPDHIRTLNKQDFSKQIKAYLLKQAFYSVGEFLDISVDM